MSSSLSEWQSFYVIVGSSGAALTGLMFVVVALAADRIAQTGRASNEVAAFSTPTVVHFGMVLLVASVMTMPLRGGLALGVLLAACAAVGLTFSVLAIVRMHRLTLYKPVAEDWIWNAILPTIAYAALLAGAVVLGAAADAALYVVAAVALLLLFTGIHNAWDVALYTVTNFLPNSRSEDVRQPVDDPRQPAPAQTE